MVISVAVVVVVVVEQLAQLVLEVEAINRRYSALV
jgi:hypothetical protein